MDNYDITKKDVCDSIAEYITEQTGVSHELVKEEGNLFVYNFNIGKSYMTNQNGEKMYFALVDEDNNVLYECGKKSNKSVVIFMKAVIYTISQYDNYKKQRG